MRLDFLRVFHLAFVFFFYLPCAFLSSIGKISYIFSLAYNVLWPYFSGSNHIKLNIFDWKTKSFCVIPNWMQKKSIWIWSFLGIWIFQLCVCACTFCGYFMHIQNSIGCGKNEQKLVEALGSPQYECITSFLWWIWFLIRVKPCARHGQN